MFYALIGVLAVCFIAVLYLILTAPDGYEDNEGFHYDRKDDE